MIALLVSLTTAHAQELVLTAGNPTSAVTTAAEDANVSVASLTASTLSTLLSDRPTVLRGAGTALHCTGPDTRSADVASAVARIESDLLFLDFAQAMRDADTAMDVLGCLTEPVDGALASRVLYLRGIALHYAGNADGASQSFRQAHIFQPGLAWDDNYAPDPRPLFDEALLDLGSAATATLSVVPGPQAVPVFIDGRRVTRDVTLSSGEHLVQVGSGAVATVRLELPPGGNSTLFVPSAINDRAVAWAADPTRSADLSLVLSTVLGDGERVYVVHNGQTWRGVTGGGGFTLIETRPAVTAPPVTSTSPTPRFTEGSRFDDPPPIVDPPREPKPMYWLLPPGIGLMAVGGGYSAYSFVQASEHRRDARDAPDLETWNAAAAEYDKWGGRFTTGNVLAGIGAALTLVGATVKIDDAGGLAVVPTHHPGQSGGLAIALRR